MQLHDILLLRTSAILPEAISAGGIDSQLIYKRRGNSAFEQKHRKKTPALTTDVICTQKKSMFPIYRKNHI